MIDMSYMIGMFHRGGPLMYPLLFGSILMIAVVIERAFHFMGTGNNRVFINNVRDYIERGDYEGAMKFTCETKGPVPAIIQETLLYRKSPQEVLENKLSIRGDQILSLLSKNLHLLELLGKISPMIGLLGTVLGMVEAFERVSVLKSAVDPSILASGIWEALLTTVAGLFVGIPALIFYHLYMNRLKSIAFSMKHYGEETLSMIRGKSDRV